jgi:nucleoside diphosphate kinase
LIYSAAGNAATTATDNVKIENNILTLVVKKGTVISAAKPIKFYVKASADNFVSNFEEITITSVDKLQYINLTLLNIANLPKGITNTTASTPASEGTIQEDFVVNVSSTTDGVTENVVSALPANTTFFDANNTAIKTAGDLNVSVTNFNPAVEGATGDIPGGINATTATGGMLFFR